MVVHVVRGDRDPALRGPAIAALQSLEGVLRASELALYYAALGEREAALERVQQAYDEGVDPHLPLRLIHPLFDPLRGEPRFAAIADGLGVEAPLAGTAVSPAGASLP